MIREEAIKHLETYSTTNGSGQTTQAQHEEAKRMAIKALEQEPCEDVPEINVGDIISRQAVLDKKELIELEDGQSFYCISPEDVETLPPVNPQYTEVEGQKSEDAISRQAAIEIARSNIHYGLDKEYEYARELLQKTMAEINSLPPVTPQPKTGNWINGDCKGGNCSICGEYYAFYPESGDFNYCPNCGAKMIDLPDTNVGKLSEIPTGSDDELYSDCIDAFKEYALGRKERRGINGRMDRICNSKNPQ